jgi:hypothetical protein
MEPLFEILERYGFISDDDATKTDDLSEMEAMKLYEAVYSTVYETQRSDADNIPEGNTQIDPFRFMASASMRGDSGCWEPQCRLRKLDVLGSFSALYANKVTLPLILEHPDNVSSIETARNHLFLTMMTLIRLRTEHCVHVKSFVDEMKLFIHDVADWYAKKCQQDFKAVFQLPDKSPSGRSTVYLEGPEDLLEHGSLVWLFDEGPDWRAKSWKYDSKGQVELRGKKKLYFIEKIFNTIANNTTFYLAYGQQHNARLLTDLAGDAYLLDLISEDEKLKATSMAMGFLSHTVPLLADISLATLIRIRQEERDSFESYRNAITSLTSEVLTSDTSLSIQNAKDAFKEKLEPQIAKLKKEMSLERSRQRKRILVGTSALVASVVIGAYGGLPILVKGALTAASAMVGGRLLTSTAESVCEHGADLRQHNDLYFILRLMEE